jgi:hypothetical protein
MTRKTEKLSITASYAAAMSIVALILIAFSTSSAAAQGNPDAIMGSKRSGTAPVMKRLVGEIHVQKNFGVIPMGPGNKQAAPMPCGQFSIAVYDANRIKDNRPPIAKTGAWEQGKDRGDLYICRYEMQVPANIRLWVTPVMGGTLLLPKEDRTPMYITDAWIGGTNNKPPRGWERGFVGRYATITGPTQMNFDLTYNQVDPR